MQNVFISVEGRKLRLEIDLDGEVSKSGRGNTVVATSENWVRIPEAGEGFSMNFVVVRKGK